MTTSMKILPFLFLSIAIIVTSYRSFVDTMFYVRNNFDFSIDNEYSGTTFSTDGPHDDHKESNRRRILIGSPLTLFFLYVSFFILILA